MYMKNFIWFLPYKPSKLSEENLTVNGWAWAEIKNKGKYVSNVNIKAQVINMSPNALLCT